MTPLQEAWKRAWAHRRDDDGPAFEAAMHDVVQAATREGLNRADVICEKFNQEIDSELEHYAAKIAKATLRKIIKL